MVITQILILYVGCVLGWGLFSLICSIYGTVYPSDNRDKELLDREGYDDDEGY